MRQHCTVLAAAAALAISAPAQTVVEGSGAALQQAVDAASPGEILLVRSGGYMPVLVTKGLTLVFEPGAWVQNQFPGRAAVHATIPAGQTLLLRDPDFRRGSLEAQMLVARDCAGLIVVEGGAIAGTISTHRCTGLALNRVSAQQVEMVETQASVVDCAIGPGAACGPEGCGAMVALASRVVVSGGSIVGTGILLPVPGILLDAASALTVANGSGARIEGGITGGIPGPLEPAIAAQGGAVVLDPAAVLVSGSSEPVEGASSLVLRATPGISAAGAPPGEVFSVTAFAPPGSVTSSLLHLPALPLPTPFGAWWLGGLPLAVDVGVVGPAGARTVTLVVPQLPPAAPLAAQATAVLPPGELVLSPAAVVVMH